MGVIHKSDDGNIVFLQRDDTPNIFYRIKNPYDGGWIQRTAKTSKLEEAEQIARKHSNDIQYRMQFGLALVPKSFHAIADMYIQELTDEIVADLRNERILRDYEPIIERYFKAYFGDREIDTIQTKDITAYRDWRNQYWISGPGSEQKFIEYVRNDKRIRKPAPKRKAPSKQAVNVENVVLRGIFNTALKHGHVKEHQLPSIRTPIGPRNKKNRRASFTKEEYETLISFLFEWCRQADDRWPELAARRQLLWRYVTFLFHSGLRPGSETDGLCWKHVKEVHTSSGEKRYRLTITGKTGTRYPVVTASAVAALDNIRVDNRKPSDPNEPVFCLPDGTHVKNDYFRQLFRKALVACDLLHDEMGNARSLYSCRHSYATFLLLYQDVNVYKLAVQMGTSVRMIEEHYGHVLPEQAIDELTGADVDDEFDIQDWLKDEMQRAAAEAEPE